jgi:hypothetical protein
MMIEIFRRNEGKDRLICKFDTFDELFTQHRIGEGRITAAFGHNPEDRTEGNYLFGENRDVELEFLSHHVYVCYENDKLVTPDRLVGLWREYCRNVRNPYRYGWFWERRRSRGEKKQAYGHWRAPKTTNERRWAHAWDDEEFAPRTGFARGRRRANALPNLWDDLYGHNDKSWKTQSKRRHQWR